MLLKLRVFYHLRKPRTLSQTQQSYRSYADTINKRRRQLHLQSVTYQQQIQDRYLDEHKQLMKNKHFQHQCSFRKQIFTDAYRLFQNQEKWKYVDGNYNANLNKYLHEEDIKKINRTRILKIMEHQSQHYWLNSQNVEQRLTENAIFPQYVASSEYYYKLFAEALAYEMGDFHQLHMVSSNEEIIRQKNKYLIPIYLNLRAKIKQYKRDQVQQLNQTMLFEINLIKNNNNLSQEQKDGLERQVKEKVDKKLKEIQENNIGDAKIRNLKLKIKDLIAIFKTWKQYTNILALTSAQVIKNNQNATSQLVIQKAQRQVLKNLTSNIDESFVDSVEEDTQQIQISFEEYLSKINQERKQKEVAVQGSAAMEDLDALLNSIEDPIDNEAGENISLEKEDGGLKVLSDLSKIKGSAQVSNETGDELSPLYLNKRQTTASVETLKQQFKDDKEMLLYLNQLGQIDVRYPKLFEAIWQSTH